MKSARQALVNRILTVTGIGMVMAGVEWRSRSRQASIAAARDQAEAASQAKSRFLAVMSHELRTPLNAILGYAELVEECPAVRADAEALGDLERIREASSHLTQLIGDLLDVTHLESGSVVFERVSVDMSALVTGVVTSSRDSIEANGNKLSAEVGESFILQTDAGRVTRVVEAIVANAGKFCQDGSVVVNTHHDSSRWWVEVSDTGIGIAEESLESIFVPFTQVHGDLHAQYGGMGLSLSLSRLLARQLGGDLTVESELGVGSCFRLVLPI